MRNVTLQVEITCLIADDVPVDKLDKLTMEMDLTKVFPVLYNKKPVGQAVSWCTTEVFDEGETNH